MSTVHTAKALHLSHLLGEDRSPAFLLDLSLEMFSSEPMPGEGTDSSLSAAYSSLNAIVLAPEQIEYAFRFFIGKERPFIVGRLDWMMVPPKCEGSASSERRPTHGAVSDVEDLLFLGAEGVMASYLLGYGDNSELASFDTLNRAARDAWVEGIPLLVDIRDFGPGLAKGCYGHAVEMSVSISIELGADVVVIPGGDANTLEHLREFCPIPILVRSQLALSLEESGVFSRKRGIRGFVLEREHFELPDTVRSIRKLRGE